AILFRSSKPWSFANGWAAANRPFRLDSVENLFGGNLQGVKLALLRRETGFDLLGNQQLTQQLQDLISNGGLILFREELLNIANYGPQADVIFLTLGQDVLFQGFRGGHI